MNICAHTLPKSRPFCVLVLNQTPEAEFWVEQKRIALLLCRQRETHQASVSKKLCVSTPVNLIRVYSSGSKVGSLTRLGYKRVLHSPSLFSGGQSPKLIKELLSPLSSFHQVISWLLLSWLVTVQICPLELREKSQWLESYIQEMGDSKASMPLWSPTEPLSVSQIWVYKWGAGSEERLLLLSHFSHVRLCETP